MNESSKVYNTKRNDINHLFAEKEATKLSKNRVIIFKRNKGQIMKHYPESIF